MVKKLFTYIFIYTLLVGCNTLDLLTNVSDTSIDTNIDQCESEFEYMNIGATSLERDMNGYYHTEWLEGYNQTFNTLEVITNAYGYNKIYWGCDSGIEYGGEFVSCVNPASYTNNGTAHTVMAVWEEMIGDTITIYAMFEDDCYIKHIDSMDVIVDNEIQN